MLKKGIDTAVQQAEQKKKAEEERKRREAEEKRRREAAKKNAAVTTQTAKRNAAQRSSGSMSGSRGRMTQSTTIGRSGKTNRIEKAVSDYTRNIASGVNAGIQNVGNATIGTLVRGAGKVAGGIAGEYTGQRNAANPVSKAGQALAGSRQQAEAAFRLAQVQSTTPGAGFVGTLAYTAPEMAVDFLAGGIGATRRAAKAGGMLARGAFDAAATQAERKAAGNLGRRIMQPAGQALSEADKATIGFRAYRYAKYAYDDNIERGMSPAEALNNAVLQALPNALIESGGVNRSAAKALSQLGKEANTKAGASKLWKFFTEALGEGGEEMSQTVVSNLSDKITSDKDMPWLSTDPEQRAVVNVPELLQAGALGAAGGLVMGGAVRGGSALLNGRMNENISPEQKKQIVEAVLQREVDADVAEQVYASIEPELREAMQNEPRYLISRTVDNKPFVEIDEDILAGVPKSEWLAAVKKTMDEKYPDGIDVNGQHIKVNAKTKGEFAYSEYTKRLRSQDKQQYADKLRTANNLDEVIEATQDWKGEEAKHDNFKEFGTGNVLMRIGGNDYTARVVVGTSADGSAAMYDIVSLNPTTIQTDTKKRAHAQEFQPEAGLDSDGALSSISDINISDPGSVVNHPGQNNLVQGGEFLSEASRGKVQQLAAASGRSVVVHEDLTSPVPGRTVNGYIDDDGTIHLNARAEKPELFVIGHELTHWLQETSPELYRQFRALALQISGTTTQDVQAKRALYAPMWRGKYTGEQMNELAIDEIVADFAGQMVDDPALFERMVRTDRNLAERIYDFIREMLTNMRAAFGSADAKLEQAADLWAKMLGRSVEAPVETRLNERDYSFAGTGAQTADVGRLQTAEQMESEGADNEAIWQATGWFRGMDGQWRFEINDSEAVFDWDNELLQQGKATLADVMQNDEMFAAYPELRDIPVRFAELDPRVAGEYTMGTSIKGRTPIILLNESNKTMPSVLENTLIHETQHAIQDIEGFARGSSPDYWNSPENSAERERAAARLLDEIDNLQQMLDEDPDSEDAVFIQGDIDSLAEELEDLGYFLYFNTAGEIEARNAAARLRLSAEERRRISPITDDPNVVFAEQEGGRRASMSRQGGRPKKASVEDLIKVRTGALNGKPHVYAIDYPEMKATKKQNVLYKLYWRGKGKDENVEVEEAQLAAERVADYVVTDDFVREFKLRFPDAELISPVTGGSEVTKNNLPIFFAAKLSNAVGVNVYSGILQSETVNMSGIKNDADRKNQTVAFEFANGYNEDGLKGKKFVVLDDTIKTATTINQLAQFIEKNGGTVIGYTSLTKGSDYTNDQTEEAPGGENRSLYSGSPQEKRQPGLQGVGNQRRSGAGDATGLGGSYKSIPGSKGDLKEQQNNENAQDDTGRFSSPSDTAKRRWSMSEAPETSEGTLAPAEDVALNPGDSSPGESASAFDALPTKAQDYVRRAENGTLNRLLGVFGGDKYVDLPELRQMVRAATEEYLATGRISQETIDNLFKEAHDRAQVIREDFYNENKEIKDYLRSTPVRVSQSDKANFGGKEEWNNFLRSAMGTLRIANDGMDVGKVYQELSDMNPELFPPELNSGSDQIRQMLSVGRSIRRIEDNIDLAEQGDADEVEAFARNDFGAAMNELAGEIGRARRYADDRESGETVSNLLTNEEMRELRTALGEARRARNRVTSRVLLTREDNELVDRMLKGEIQSIDENHPNYRAIMQVYEARQAYEAIADVLAQHKVAVRQARVNKAKSIMGDIGRFKDKGAGWRYQRETQERNIRDIAPDAKTADKMIEEYFRPVHQHEAEAIRFKERYRQQVRRLGLSRKVVSGNMVSESHAVQLLGEAQDYLTRATLTGQPVEGHTAEEWQQIIDELHTLNPRLNWGKIDKAIESFRTIYDELYQQMNDVRVANGYEEVEYRRSYFPHFQPGDGGGLLGALAGALGVNGDVQNLPTTINGLTHQFSPGIRWFGNTQQRLGFGTVYDAVEGFDKYIEGVADVIHHTEDIQNVRALENTIRYLTSDEGIRERIDAVLADKSLSTDEVNERIEALTSSGRFDLSNYAVNLHEYANILANKRSLKDRQWEQMFGRKFYNVAKKVESRVAANMVAINPGSWLTNLIPLAQGGSELGTGQLLNGMWRSLRSYVRGDDGVIAASDFLTGRRGSDPLVKTYEQSSNAPRAVQAVSRVGGKVGDVLASPMGLIDRFVTDSLVRARYTQNLKAGTSEAEAMREADAWVASVVGDRSKGAQPTVFAAQNPVTKILTQFQLEVNNELSHLAKDIPDKNAGVRLAIVLLKYMLGAFLFNELYEYIVGRRPALDPIGLLNESVGDFTGYELPNLVELGVAAAKGEASADDFRTKQENAGAATVDMAKRAAGQLPFVGGLLEGGRVPISSALPSLSTIGDTLASDKLDTGQKAERIAKEIGNTTGVYMLPPFGGGQAKKIAQGIKTLREGGSYKTDSDGNERLQYYAPQDTTAEKVGSAARTLLFGKTSLPTGRQWIEEGFPTLSAKATATYQELVEGGMSQKDAYEAVRAIAGAKQTDEASAYEMKMAAMRDLNVAKRDRRSFGLTADQQGIIYENMIAGDEDREKLQSLYDLGVDKGDAYIFMQEMKEVDGEKDAEDKTISGSVKAEKVDVLKNSSLTRDQQAEYWLDNIANESEAAMAAKLAGYGVDPADSYQLVADGVKVYDSTLDRMDSAVKAGFEPTEYIKYASEASSFTADRDNNGKAINGTKKRKVLKYIDELDLDQSQKDELYYAAGYKASTIADAPWHTGKKIVPTAAERKGSGSSGSRKSSRSKKSSGRKKSSKKSAKSTKPKAIAQIGSAPGIGRLSGGAKRTNKNTGIVPIGKSTGIGRLG
jgi:Zn-dependent peptidase ImmA (M78 family)